MNNLLEKLFIENSFEKFSRNVYGFKGDSLFIVADYREADLIDFFECGATKEVLGEYKVRSGHDADLKKNTSLLICLKVDDISAAQTKLRNTIFNIEEDEYYFRKFVILYTDDMVESIDVNINIRMQLKEIVKSGDIDKLRVNHFYDKRYFFALQLYIKLPWLSFEVTRSEFELLGRPLNRMVSENNLNEIDDLIDSIDEEKFEILIDGSKHFSGNEEEFNTLLSLFGE